MRTLSATPAGLLTSRSTASQSFGSPPGRSDGVSLMSPPRISPAFGGTRRIARSRPPGVVPCCGIDGQRDEAPAVVGPDQHIRRAAWAGVPEHSGRGLQYLEGGRGRDAVCSELLPVHPVEGEVVDADPRHGRSCFLRCRCRKLIDPEVGLPSPFTVEVYDPVIRARRLDGERASHRHDESLLRPQLEPGRPAHLELTSYRPEHHPVVVVLQDQLELVWLVRLV